VRTRPRDAFVASPERKAPSYSQLIVYGHSRTRDPRVESPSARDGTTAGGGRRTAAWEG